MEKKGRKFNLMEDATLTAQQRADGRAEFVNTQLGEYPQEVRDRIANQKAPLDPDLHPLAHSLLIDGNPPSPRKKQNIRR